MKLSDYIAEFLAQQGVRHVFAITGGASLHMIDSIAKRPDIDYICPHHEQAGAMAADAYSRMSGNLGVAIGTSGPGGTNMITGICSSYYDSVPTLFITGQVSTFRFKSHTGVRQMGFQETEIVPMCKPITKYAVTITKPESIRYELEKAVWTAKSGRPGPVLVDVPDNLQREEIEPETLERFIPPTDIVSSRKSVSDAVRTSLAWLKAAERPIIVLGWGVRLAGAEQAAIKLVERLGVPVNLTWATNDMFPEAHPLRCGTFGTHGTRFGNFALQNADLVISIGSRLDTHMIGSPFSTFCRGGKKIVVDIDPTETRKFSHYGLEIDLAVEADAKDFIGECLLQTDGWPAVEIVSWQKRIRDWKKTYASVRPEYFQSNTLNPYVFIKSLSDAAEEGEVIVSDTGCGLAWACQAFEFKKGQRFFSSFNNTPMGYALPGALGASLALGRKRILCIVGDGSLMMNLQELSTIHYHKLPIKIFNLDNGGYSMIQQTQDQWLDGRYEGSSQGQGLGFPDFHRLAEAWDYPVISLQTNRDAMKNIRDFISTPGPGFCNVKLRPDERVIPQVKFGRPIEDSEPLLPRPEFLGNMIVEPMDVSKR